MPTSAIGSDTTRHAETGPVNATETTVAFPVADANNVARSTQANGPHSAPASLRNATENNSAALSRFNVGGSEAHRPERAANQTQQTRARVATTAENALPRFLPLLPLPENNTRAQRNETATEASAEEHQAAQGHDAPAAATTNHTAETASATAGTRTAESNPAVRLGLSVHSDVAINHGGQMVTGPRGNNNAQVIIQNITNNFTFASSSLSLPAQRQPRAQTAAAGNLPNQAPVARQPDQHVQAQNIRADNTANRASAPSADQARDAVPNRGAANIAHEPTLRNAVLRAAENNSNAASTSIWDKGALDATVELSKHALNGLASTANRLGNSISLKTATTIAATALVTTGMHYLNSKSTAPA